MQQVKNLIINAKELITVTSDLPKYGSALQDLGIIEDGAIAYENDQIIAVGTTKDILSKYTGLHTIDAKDKIVLPGFVDPHTHLPYAGSRHEEYEYKIAGKTYQDLHKLGGIRYTVEMTRAASTEELVQKALKDLDIMLLHGTTLVEAKSGYGLDKENELKLLQVIKRVNEQHVVDVIPTFLGAHTVPAEYQGKQNEYVQFVKDLIPEVVELAEFCDVWCDNLGFSYDETQEIFEVAQKNGLKLKIHSEQTGNSKGTELAAEMGAVSADHLDFVSEAGIQSMKNNGTIPVLLPGVTYHLMEFDKQIPVRKMIDAELPVALATDYNPGSCRTQSMQAIMTAAARLFKMNYAEIINAATINAAYAVDRGQSHGSLDVDKQADIIICDTDSHGVLMNNFGINHVNTVIKSGNLVVQNQQILHSQH